MTTKTVIAAMIVVAATLASAIVKADAGHGADFGKPGEAKKVSRTINIISSDDFTYRPSEINVKRGETIRLLVKNTGKIDHELVVGPMKDLKAHAEVMRKHPGMEHDEPNQAMVRPGETRAIIWQFTQTGIVDFGCTIPGHLEAGMTGIVKVGVR